MVRDAGSAWAHHDAARSDGSKPRAGSGGRNRHRRFLRRFDVEQYVVQWIRSLAHSVGRSGCASCAVVGVVQCIACTAHVSALALWARSVTALCMSSRALTGCSSHVGSRRVISGPGPKGGPELALGPFLDALPHVCSARLAPVTPVVSGRRRYPQRSSSFMRLDPVAAEVRHKRLAPCHDAIQSY